METPRRFYRAPLVSCLLVILLHISVNAQHPLDTWARRLVPGFTGNLSSVAYGNGKFVAVGDGSSVLTSLDGITWTVGNAGAYGNLARVRFINGEFIAVGTSDKILFSTHGLSWTPSTLPSADSWDVAYGNGVYVTAGATTYVSNDGVTWAMSRGSLDSVAYGNGRFVALSTGDASPGGGFPKAFNSSNGVDWVAGFDTGNTASGRGEVIFGGLFLCKPSQRSGILATSDGTDSCCFFNGKVTTPNFNGGLAHGRGYFVWAVFSTYSYYSGHQSIHSSTNGISWQTRYAPSILNPGENDPTLQGHSRGAAFGNDTFVFVGDGGFILQSGNLGGAPLITTQPQDRAAILDNPASFSVQASGSLPLVYQWFHGNNPIPDATNSTHAIAQVQTSDNGGYQVLITNSFGSVTSRVAQLSVSFLDIAAYAGVKILGVPGRTYRIEATTTGGPFNWQTLTNIVLPSSPHIWIDFASPQAGQRLYRVAELP